MRVPWAKGREDRLEVFHAQPEHRLQSEKDHRAVQQRGQLETHGIDQTCLVGPDGHEPMRVLPELKRPVHLTVHETGWGLPADDLNLPVYRERSEFDPHGKTRVETADNFSLQQPDGWKRRGNALKQRYVFVGYPDRLEREVDRCTDFKLFQGSQHRASSIVTHGAASPLTGFAADPARAGMRGRK